MKSWAVNTIRVPMNEDCWLGINGVKPEYGGQAYREALASFVKMLRSHGMYVIVDLHLNAPGGSLAKSQQPMADADHSIDFWTSVAKTFKGDAGVVFDLYNEPNIDGAKTRPSPSWQCWRDGCPNTCWTGFPGTANTAGMQPMLDAVRAAGARNVVLVNGLGMGEYLGEPWLAHQPRDPLQETSSPGHHNYSFNEGCNTPCCWQSDGGDRRREGPGHRGRARRERLRPHLRRRVLQLGRPGRPLVYIGWTWNPLGLRVRSGAHQGLPGIPHELRARVLGTLAEAESLR